ncbi:hypothetical protein NFI96_031004 [Prochilodus magdalenae]|nr:hypothetical protein NFI96_031004 [Prochilodus magdalenae]
MMEGISSLPEQKNKCGQLVGMDSESQLQDLRTDAEGGSSSTHPDESEHQQESPLDTEQSPGFSASCLTTAELQQHWRAVKQEMRCIKLLFEIPSTRTIEQACSRYVVYQIVVIRSGSYDCERVAIERRYSDFLHLHQQLLQDFNEELEEVTLPRKKLVGNFSEENIVERRVALCDYLTQLYTRRYIRRTPTFIAFFTHPELKNAYDLLRGGRFSQALEVLQKVLVLQNKLCNHEPALLVPTMCAVVVCQRDLGYLHDAFQTGHKALPAVRRYGLNSETDKEKVKMANDGSTKLSKNLLRMKFMQRGLDAEAKKQLEEEEKRIISDEHWYLDLPELKAKESYIVEERSYIPCEDLAYGRMSFKGFNPEVEKLMILMNTPKDKDEEEEEEDDMTRMDTDITDEDMAKRYGSLVESMKKRFAKKRQRSSIKDSEEDVNHNVVPSHPKKAFLKPKD